MMNPEARPVFYDPKRRRVPIAMALALCFSLAGALFCVSLAVAPLLPAAKLPHPRFLDNLELSNPALTRREIVERRVALRHDIAQLAVLNERHRQKLQVGAARTADHRLRTTGDRALITDLNARGRKPNDADQ